MPLSMLAPVRLADSITALQLVPGHVTVQLPMVLCSTFCPRIFGSWPWSTRKSRFDSYRINGEPIHPIWSVIVILVFSHLSLQNKNWTSPEESVTGQNDINFVTKSTAAFYYLKYGHMHPFQVGIHPTAFLIRHDDTTGSESCRQCCQCSRQRRTKYRSVRSSRFESWPYDKHGWIQGRLVDDTTCRRCRGVFFIVVVMVTVSHLSWWFLERIYVGRRDDIGDRNRG